MSATYPFTMPMSLPRIGRNRQERIHALPRPTQGDRLRSMFTTLSADPSFAAPSVASVTREMATRSS